MKRSDDRADVWDWLPLASPLISGVLLVLVSLLLSAALTWHKLSAYGWIHDLISHFSVALLVSGVLLITVEPLSRRREQIRETLARRQIRQVIARIRRAHALSVLHDMIPKAIFRAVEAQIIRQPFLRKRFSVRMYLERCQQGKELLQTVTSDYDLVNTSKKTLQYVITIWLEKHEGAGSLTEINFVKASSKWPLDEGPRTEPRNATSPTEHKKIIELTKEQLSSPQFVSEREDAVEAKIPIWLSPGQSVRVEIQYQRVVAERDNGLIVVLVPTERMELTAEYPPDVMLSAEALHTDRFDTEPPTPAGSNLLHRQISTALLPCQGIQLYWRPKLVALPKEDREREHSVSSDTNMPTSGNVTAPIAE